MHYALQYPERVERLVLVAPLPPTRELWTDYLGAFARRAGEEPQAAAFAEIDRLRTSGKKRRNPEGYAGRVRDASLGMWLRDPAHAERMKSEPVALPNLDPDDASRIARGILGALDDWDWSADLRRLDVPVLVVHGDAGLLPLAGAERYAAELPRAELLRLEDVGHLPWLEAPERFFPPVLRFLGDAARP